MLYASYGSGLDRVGRTKKWAIAPFVVGQSWISPICAAYADRKKRLGRCSNLVKNADTIFWGAKSTEICWKNLPLSKISADA